MQYHSGILECNDMWMSFNVQMLMNVLYLMEDVSKAAKTQPAHISVNVKMVSCWPKISEVAKVC